MGSDRQEFELDVAWNLTGSLSYRDWSVVRGDGSVATITAGASDASTWFTAMRDGSTACADAGRGMTLEGMGRLDTGDLIAFSVITCDNGASGSGADVFRLSVPAAGNYEGGGRLSSGDVVKSSGTTPTAAVGISGLGAIGAGTPTLGSDRQEFEFEAGAAGGGRMVFTDYGVLRGNGLPGRMVVEEADPGSGVTSFHQRSARCVRFSGTGRLDTGEVWPFYVDACDNASPGTGFDSFAFLIPDRGGRGIPYTRSGTLTAGDILLSGGGAPATGGLVVTASTTGTSPDP